MSVTDIGITKPWNEATVSAGAEISSKGIFQSKSQKLLTEDFEDALSAEFGSALAGGATQAVGSGVWQLNANGTSVLGVIYYDASGNVAPNLAFALKLRVYTDTGVTVIPFGIGWKSSAPVTNEIISSFVYLSFSTLNTAFFRYTDNNGVAQYWNGSGWQTGAVTVSVDLLQMLDFRVFSDGTQVWFLLKTQGGAVVADTSGAKVNWSAVYPIGTDTPYIFVGDSRTGRAQINLWSSLEIWNNSNAGDYLTSAQTCETDAYDTTENFNSEDITVKLGRTPASATEIKVYVKEDSGSYGSAHNVNVSPISGETGWFAIASGGTYNNHSTSVTLKVEINSPDGSTQIQVLEVKIKGVTVAGGGGGISRARLVNE